MGHRYHRRLYDIDGNDEREVTVKIERSGKGFVRETKVALRITTVCVAAPCVTGEPSFASIDLRDAAGAGPVDITVSSKGARLWAFVSATNNDTQHVTTYMLQR